MLTLNFNTVFICFHSIWSGDCGAFRNRRDWRGWGDIRSEKVSVTHSLSTWNNREWVKKKFLTPSLNGMESFSIIGRMITKTTSIELGLRADAPNQSLIQNIENSRNDVRRKEGSQRQTERRAYFQFWWLPQHQTIMGSLDKYCRLCALCVRQDHLLKVDF